MARTTSPVESKTSASTVMDQEVDKRQTSSKFIAGVAEERGREKRQRRWWRIHNYKSCMWKMCVWHKLALKRSVWKSSVCQRYMRKSLVCVCVCEKVLVGGSVAMFYFPIYWDSNHPNWRTIFFRGVALAHQPEVVCERDVTKCHAPRLPWKWMNQAPRPRLPVPGDLRMFRTLWRSERALV